MYRRLQAFQSKAALLELLTIKKAMQACNRVWQKVTFSNPRIWIAVAGLGCLLHADTLSWLIVPELRAHAPWQETIRWSSHYRGVLNVYQNTLAGLTTDCAVWILVGLALIAVSSKWPLHRGASRPSA